MSDSLLPLIAPYLASRVHRAMLRPWLPHRLLTMRPEPLAARTERVHAMWTRSSIASRSFFETFIADVCGAALTRHADDAAFGPLIEFAADLFIQNNLYLPAFPRIDLSRSLSATEIALAEQKLIEIETLCSNEERILGTFHDDTCALLRDLDAQIPRGPARGALQVPLYALFEPTAQSAQRWLVTFLIGLPANRDAVNRLAFSETAHQLWLNLCAASRLAPEEAEAHPNRIKAPLESNLDPEGIIGSYLHHTPMAKLLTAPIAFAIPRKAFNEHGAVFAKSGHGKTQTLRAFIANFLQEDDPPALFIIDSLGSLIEGIADLEIFSTRLKDRLVILDPSDPAHVPSLNFFQLQSDDLCFYLFKAIDQSFTQRQATMIAYLMEFMRHVPGANLLALINVCVSKDNPYPEIIDRLSPFARSFFEHQFYAKKPDPLVQQTKSQIAARIYTLARMPKFEQIFSSSRNVFDPLRCMQEKKIVLINTDARPARLGGLDAASAIFGRFILALCLDAARGRPKDQRDLALLVCDEAKAYMDEHASLILSDARQFGLGMLLATQFPHQLEEGVRREINTNTSIRLMGPIEYAVASQYARDMFTTPEFIMGMRAQDRSHTEWAAFVSNMTDRAVKLTVPYGVLEGLPRRSQRQLDMADALDEKHKPSQITPPSGSPTSPLPKMQVEPSVTQESPQRDPSGMNVEAADHPFGNSFGDGPPRQPVLPKPASANDDDDYSSPMKGA